MTAVNLWMMVFGLLSLASVVMAVVSSTKKEQVHLLLVSNNWTRDEKIELRYKIKKLKELRGCSIMAILLFLSLLAGLMSKAGMLG